jgi:hypothetical protein
MILPLGVLLVSGLVRSRVSRMAVLCIYSTEFPLGVQNKKLRSKLCLGLGRRASHDRSSLQGREIYATSWVACVFVYRLDLPG